MDILAPSRGGKAHEMFDYRITPTPFASVSVLDAFWRPRLETNRAVSLPAIFRKCEESGRLNNFRKAAGILAGPYEGVMPFEDTEVYKAIEGASYSLAQHPDPALDAFLDGLIALIAGAQEEDGYLYTNRTIDPTRTLPFAGPKRWSSLVMSHELYNCGHLFEAACAHALATGKSSLRDVAVRAAELILREFGPDARHDLCGHQIVEMGLARLYRLTGERRYLEEARFFLEQRGRHESRPLYLYEENPGYCQDHLPVLEQNEAVGHAVRAMYMYCGMADIAALYPDAAYATAIENIWRDVVESKIYLTGGIGARHKGEAFGEAFELPNMTAYAETCASIGSVMWNHRLFLLTGESKYIDVLEQTLYNSLLAGASLNGQEFFYTNPLASDGKYRFNHGSAGRQPWFTVSCCPTNLSRFFPSLPGYVYATADDTVYVNLYMASTTRIDVDSTQVLIRQDTDYPWSGSVRLTLDFQRSVHMRLLVRIPGWARGRILGGSLYRFRTPSADQPYLMLDGVVQALEIENGYAVLDREWSGREVVELLFPLSVRAVLCDSRVEENLDHAAIQRGPIVYCVEGRDSDRPLDTICLGEESRITAHREPELLGGVVVLRAPGYQAVPYYAWGNRGIGPMRVWLNDAR